MTIDQSQSAAQPRIGHVPALDGLRGVAVGAVIAFHFLPQRLSGGFLGVDTFFVVSGYLITSLLLAEWRGSSTISLRSFWARRARRLLPALYLTLMAVAIASAVWLPSFELDRLRGDGLASLLYVTNWRLIDTGQSYFDLSTAPSPLRHLWSLAIEEQYYVMWPLAVLACLRVGRGSRLPLALLCGAGTVASAAVMALVWDASDESRAYYGSDSRAQVILVGAGLAVILEGDRLSSWRRSLGLQIAGIAAFAWCAWLWVAVSERDDWLYRGGFLAYALATAVLMTAVIGARSGPLGWLLALPPVQAVGRVSYGLYLWHWPVQVFATPGRTGLDDAQLLLFKLALTALLTVASYLLVEQPIRQRRWPVVLVRRLGPASAVAVLLAVLLATLGATPVPDHLRGPEQLAATPAVVRPSRSTEPSPTDVTLPTSAVLFGDSVSLSLQDDLAEALAARGVVTVKSSVGGCGMLTGEPLQLEGQPEPFGQACSAEVQRRQTADTLEYRPEMVVWLSYWEWRDRLVDGAQVEIGTPEGDRVILRLMADTVDRVTSTGGRLVVLLLPVPQNTDSYTHQVGFADTVPHLNDLFRRLAASDPARVSLVDLDEIVCAGASPCPEDRDGMQIRVDGLHFTEEGAAWTAPRLADALLDPALWREP